MSQENTKEIDVEYWNSLYNKLEDSSCSLIKAYEHLVTAHSRLFGENKRLYGIADKLCDGVYEQFNLAIELKKELEISKKYAVLFKEQKEMEENCDVATKG